MARVVAQPKLSLAVALAGGLCLTLLVIITASWNVALSEDVGVLRLFPQDPQITFEQGLQEMRSSQGRALPQIVAATDHAIHLDPLDGRPLFLRAMNAVISERKPPPIPLLEASRKRSPRLADTRLLLLEAYGRNGRADDAIAEARSIMDLAPEQRPLVTRLVAGLAGSEGGREALARALPTSAAKSDVMLRLAKTGASSAMLERFAGGMRGIGNDPAQRGWIGSLVAYLAQRPDPLAARALWSIFYDVDSAQVGTHVVNADFDNEGARPPFGWMLGASKAGDAQLRDGSLGIYYYDRAAAVFASQMLMLSPGNFRLITMATSADAQAPDAVLWQLACLETGNTLLEARVSTLMTSSAGATSFSVPAAGCTAQYLQLLGRPSDVPRRQSVQIKHVEIERQAP